MWDLRTGDNRWIDGGSVPLPRGTVMPHLCMDEINMFLMGLPFVGAGLLWARFHIARLFRRCPKPCDHVHVLPEAPVEQHEPT